MTQVSIHEAKTHLSRLIQLALAGEEVIIARRDKPLIRLTVLPEAAQQRRIGGCADVILAIAEDFDEPLSEFAAYAP